MNARESLRPRRTNLIPRSRMKSAPGIGPPEGRPYGTASRAAFRDESAESPRPRVLILVPLVTTRESATRTVPSPPGGSPRDRFVLDGGPRAVKRAMLASPPPRPAASPSRSPRWPPGPPARSGPWRRAAPVTRSRSPPTSRPPARPDRTAPVTPRPSPASSGLNRQFLIEAPTA